MTNETHDSSRNVVFWTLNGYGPTEYDLAVNAAIVILVTAAITLNAIVLDTLRRQHNLLEAADIFVAGLAIADLLNGILLLYNTIYNIVNFQIIEECHVRFGFFAATSVSSALHLGVLTIDRYTKIVSSFHYQRIFNKISNICIAISIWIFSLIIGFLPSFGWNKKPTEIDGIICSFFGIHRKSYLTLVVLLLWIPLGLIIILYLHIFTIARRHVRLIAAQEQAQRTSRSEKRTWRFTKTVCIIAGVYFLCWLPTGSIIMADLSGNLEHHTLVEKGNLLMYGSFTAFFNSLLNPVIYAFKISVVKARFYRIFCCGKKVAAINDMSAVTITVKPKSEI